MRAPLLCPLSTLCRTSAVLTHLARHARLWPAWARRASPPGAPQPTPHPLPACSKSIATKSSIDPLPGPPAGYPRVPGSFESLARDVRLRMLLSAACYEGGEYPTGQSWAPQEGGVSG